MENLKTSVQVDVSQLANLASASEQVARSTSTMAAQFRASGLSATEAASALQNLGVSAREAAIATGTFGSVVANAGKQAAEAAVGVTTMERAMAAANVRIVSSISGMGGLGSAFARVGAASSTLAPILAVGFPVIAAVAFIDIVERGVAAYEKWINLGEETVHKIDDQALSLAHESDQLDVVNARLQNQIDKLEHKPEDYMAVFLAEDKVRADALTKSLEDVLQKEIQILKAGPGSASAFFLDKGNVAELGKALEPLQAELQLADLANDKQAQKNALLKEQFLIQGFFNREAAQHVETLESAEPGGGTMQLGRAIDQDALNTYSRMLDAVQVQLDKLAKTATTSALEQQLADLKTAHDKEEAAKKYQELVDRNKEAAIRGAREEATAVARGIKEWEELETKAQRVLETGFRKNALDAQKDAKDAEEAWQQAAEARIKGEEEAQHASQANAENRMRDLKAQESLATAGLNKGPITSVIEVASLKEQSAVAAAAMQEARASAESYATELEIVKSAMGDVNTQSEEGLREFRDLAKQMVELQRLFDSAKSSADRWNATLDQIAAKSNELQATLGFSMGNIKIAMENASTAGWQSFNSAFLQMMAGGMSFTRTMQTMWTSMVDSFVTSILKMAETYVEQYVIMAAVKKIFGATDTASAAVNIAESETERQAAIGAAAAEAAVAAAMAGPAAAAAAAAATMALLEGITAYERGGIVRANLHEGEAVLPRSLTTFLLTSASAGMGGAGGPGGPGGPGGAAGAAGHTFIFNHSGSSSAGETKEAGKQFMKHAMRELRRMNRV